MNFEIWRGSGGSSFICSAAQVPHQISSCEDLEGAQIWEKIGSFDTFEEACYFLEKPKTRQNYD